MIKDISLLVGKSLAKNLAESFVDNIVKKRVVPVVGSVIYCELVFDLASHTGIYVGDDEIVHLDGSGEIEVVTAETFLNRLDSLNSAISIYVSCHDNDPVGSHKIAQRALDMAGNSLDYHLVMNNCHKFTAGCINGDFESQNILLKDVKELSKVHLDVNNWLVWELG